MRYISNDLKHVYFLLVKANQFSIMKINKNNVWNEKLTEVKRFEGSSKNYILSNVHHQNSLLTFQLIANNEKLDSSHKLENITVHFDLKTNKAKRFS